MARKIPPADEADPLLNLPVILELKDGKWTASLEGVAEPTDGQRKRLKQKEISANNDSDFEMYGDTPRKVGDEWKVDVSKIGFGGGKDLAGDYQTKLIEVKEVEGVKCAVLKSTFDFKGKLDSNPDDPLMTIGMKGEAVSIRSIADMMDLDVKINAIMTIDGAPAEHVKMHVQGPLIGTQKIKILRP